LTAGVGGEYRQALMQANVGSTDGDLARAIAARGAGSAEAAESELYRRFAPRVRLYGLRHLRNEDAARDLVQQVMLLTIEKLRAGLVREADRIASFVLGVSRTMANDLKRQEWRREKLREAFITLPVFEAQAEHTLLDVDRLEACLARLAERDRMVVLLTFYAERAAHEVGQELGITEGHVRVIRHRTIQRLRTCLTSHEAVS
jgi:RNA polymerase sigma-70 factor (ECF subfamily)